MTLLRRTLRQFSVHRGTDLAAAQTYYAVLAVVPGLVAVLALVGVVSHGPGVVDALLRIVRDVAGASAATTVRPLLRSISTSPAALPALLLGVAASVWSASGYVGAFGRSMNQVYEVEEGRSWLRQKASSLVVTLVLVVLVAVAVAIAVLSGPVAASVGRSLGLGSTVVTVWQVAQWPVLLVLVVAVVGLLYRGTGNVRLPGRNPLTLGALVAVLVTVVASVGFGFYVAHFSSYNATYGALGGLVALLVWGWLVNVSLVLGAVLDAERERHRELRDGLPAGEHLQVRPRVPARVTPAA